jgi:dipeptidyl aminopeptidase/acylaminoacyl peptidase
LRVSGPSDPPTYYLVDLKTHQASSIGGEYPDLASAKLGTVSSFTYKAHDGTAITGYLTLPPQAHDSPPPLVVLPHGGPASRDVDDDFEWLRQFLATRGYAVFQPQFRGSSGFGDSFEQAGDHQWGLLMQDDLTDGVRALIEKGQVDAHRIAIVGFSYSSGYAGYTALAGAAFTPDLYKCAISVNGISDLPRYLGFMIQMAGQYSDQVAYWRRKIGDQADPSLIERSPDHKADKISAPVLLLYSDSDAFVPINQSQLMAESLQKAGKSVQIVAIPNADHGLSRSPARLRVLEEIDKFLQDHL